MTKRDEHGRWIKGQSSPNPSGRPTSANTELRRQLAAQGASVVEKVVQAAINGDMTAAKLVLDRITPPLKPTAAPVAVSLPDDAGLAGTARAFVDAAAEGKLPPDVAGQLVTAVAALARVVEIDDLERRLAALEDAQ
ncbi:MAG: DUF5681 domain-containing protein [Pseudomonadota bacterium]